MSKKRITRKIIEAAGGMSSSGWKSSADRDKEDTDFEKVVAVVKSVENKDQYHTALKMVNNFIKKHGVRNESSKINYLQRHLSAKRLQLGIVNISRHLRRLSDDSEDLSERMMIKRIMREEIEEMGEDEDLLDEDSYWGDDEFWGTENSHWDNDPYWGSEGGDYSSGDTESDTESDF